MRQLMNLLLLAPDLHQETVLLEALPCTPCPTEPGLRHVLVALNWDEQRSRR